MNHPRVLIERPYEAQLRLTEGEDEIHIRLDNEANLPFWFEVYYDFKQNKVVRTAGRVGPQRPNVDVTVTPTDEGYKFECRDETNDWNCEFTVRGLPVAT